MLNERRPRIPLDPPELGAPIPDRFSHDGPVAFWLLVKTPEAICQAIELIGPKSSFAEFVADIEKRLGQSDMDARDRFERYRYGPNKKGPKVLDHEFNKYGFTKDFDFKSPKIGTSSVFQLLVCSPLGDDHVCWPGKCHTVLFGYMPLGLVRHDQYPKYWSGNKDFVNPGILPGFMEHISAVGHFESVEEAIAYGDKMIMSYDGTKALDRGWTSFNEGSRHERFGWSETHAMKVYVCEDKHVLSIFLPDLI